MRDQKWQLTETFSWLDKRPWVGAIIFRASIVIGSLFLFLYLT